MSFSINFSGGVSPGPGVIILGAGVWLVFWLVGSAMLASPAFIVIVGVVLLLLLVCRKMFLLPA